jgi:hypothetical protein
MAPLIPPNVPSASLVAILTTSKKPITHITENHGKNREVKMVTPKTNPADESAAAVKPQKTPVKPKTTSQSKLTQSKSISGHYRELVGKLAKDPDDIIVATRFVQETDVDYGVVASAFEDMANLLRRKIVEKNGQDLERLSDGIVSALVSTVPTPTHILTEARMRSKAKIAVLESGDWLTASEVAEVAGFETVNPSAQTSKWKAKKLIFSISHKGVDFFPGYALDPATDYRPRAAIKAVIDVFGDKKGGWGLAYWFASVNSFLGGRRPQDVIQEAPERVIAAAQDAIVGAAHA